MTQSGDLLFDTLISMQNTLTRIERKMMEFEQRLNKNVEMEESVQQSLELSIADEISRYWTDKQEPISFRLLGQRLGKRSKPYGGISYFTDQLVAKELIEIIETPRGGRFALPANAQLTPAQRKYFELRNMTESQKALHKRDMTERVRAMQASKALPSNAEIAKADAQAAEAFGLKEGSQDD